MFLFQRHYNIVFIQLLILGMKLPSLFGEYIWRDTGEIYDDSQIKAEEIIRRHKLLEPYLLQIAEEQKDWIETYHMIFGAHESVFRKKVAPNNDDLMKDPVQNKISPLHSNMVILEPKSGYPPSYSKGQDKDFVLRQNIKLKESKRENADFNIKQNLESGNLNTKHSVSPELYLNQSNIYHCSVASTKDKFLHVIKELADLKVIKPNICVLPVNEISSYTNPELDYSILKAKNTESFKFMNNDNLGLTDKSNAVPKRLHIRQKYIKSYIATLNQGRENWKENFDFSLGKDDPEENFKYPSVVEDNRYLMDNPNEVSKCMGNVKSVGNWERFYFHRWLKKLLNKLIGHPYTEHVNIVFSFSPDSLNQLHKLSTSEKYEINFVDELFTDLISNATISYDFNINRFYTSISSVHFYIFVCILLSVILVFFLIYYPYFKILLIFIVCILWHGYKMYAEKVAEKHAILSASSPEYCNSILNKESGIFAHIKEFFRYRFYDEHCKKYFEALMIDPVSQLSISIVISDLASSIFFQLFRPMARALNSFVKDLFKNLSIFQAICLFFLLILSFVPLLSIVLICNRYKLNFPFFLGSIEPTIPLRGSRVEDIPLEPKEILSKEKENSKSNVKKFPMKNYRDGNNDKLLKNHSEHCNLSQTKTCQFSKRRLSC